MNNKINESNIADINSFACWDSTEYGESLIAMITLYRYKNVLPEKIVKPLEEELKSNWTYITNNYKMVEKVYTHKRFEWEEK